MQVNPGVISFVDLERAYLQFNQMTREPADETLLLNYVPSMLHLWLAEVYKANRCDIAQTFFSCPS